MNNQRNIIGVEYDSKSLFKTIIMEDLENPCSYDHIFRVRQNTFYLYNLTFIEDLSLLMAGDCHQKAVQYDMNLDSTSGKVVARYHDLNISAIISSAYIGNLLILGGVSGLIRMINVTTRKEIHSTISVGNGYVRCIKICPVINPKDETDWKVLVCFCGMKEHSSNKEVSDIIDITGIVVQMKIPFSIIKNYNDYYQ
jgi:hypothetical protein